VRRALRVARLDLYGTSFGTKIAMRYAQEHPERVGRLLLDSTLRPSGPSALGDEVFGSLPRVLRDMCARPRCTLTRDLFGDVAALVARLRARPLRAAVFDERGRSRTAALGPVTLVDLLLEGDFVPALREALPAAIVAARAGDAAPLLRLARLDLRATPDFPVREFSSGAYAAGSCEDIPMPWDPAADPATRERQARERLAAEPRARFAPFDAATVLQADYLSLCRRWPAPVRAPVPASDVLPDVPMLFLQGEQDLRTPLEDARELAAGLPRAAVLSVPRVGHAVLVSDPTGCARRAARRFLLRRTVRGGRCPSARPVLRPVGVPPPSLAKVRRVAGLPPRIGRTLHAVDLALDDVTLAFAIGAPSGGGLRGGSFRSGPRGLVLRDFAFVPGVALTTVRRGGRLVLVVRGAAAARGRITLAGDGRFRGVLGGRRVRGRLSGGAPA
jgi:pimeloyl-ACP methyl ester carboxylesterase